MASKGSRLANTCVVHTKFLPFNGELAKIKAPESIWSQPRLGPNPVGPHFYHP
jgi:hypothetical protein